MSHTCRRRQISRVQGGWAEPSMPSGASTHAVNRFSIPSQPDQHRYGIFNYQDPIQITMAGKKPANFSWLEEGVLAGSANPSQPAHFQFYLDQGIKHVVTLTEGKPPMHKAPPGLNYVHIPILDFSAPSLPQLEEFTSLVATAKANSEAVVVHCHWGRGRTGTMLAAYLVKERQFYPQDAIKEIRQQRPYSIETCAQEDAIAAFAIHLHKQRNPEEDDEDWR